MCIKEHMASRAHGFQRAQYGQRLPRVCHALSSFTSALMSSCVSSKGASVAFRDCASLVARRITQSNQARVSQVLRGMRRARNRHCIACTNQQVGTEDWPAKVSAIHRVVKKRSKRGAGGGMQEFFFSVHKHTSADNPLLLHACLQVAVLPAVVQRHWGI